MCHIERAREAARTGYALSELINLRNFYFVHKPNGDKYLVDATAQTCDCPASVTCKHIGLVEIARNYWLALERKAQPVRRRRTFSAKHLHQLRALAPTMIGPVKPKAPAYTPTPEAIALRERCAARMISDFGPSN